MYNCIHMVTRSAHKQPLPALMEPFAACELICKRTSLTKEKGFFLQYVLLASFFIVVVVGNLPKGLECLCITSKQALGKCALKMRREVFPTLPNSGEQFHNYVFHRLADIGMRVVWLPSHCTDVTAIFFSTQHGSKWASFPITSLWSSRQCHVVLWSQSSYKALLHYWGMF